MGHETQYIQYVTQNTPIDMDFNPLAPGRCSDKFKHMLQIKFMSTCEIALRWMPQNIIDDKSTLVQVMSWCYQAPSHYLSQCWSRSMLPYAIPRQQPFCCWVCFSKSLFISLIIPPNDTCRRNSSLKMARKCIIHNQHHGCQCPCG